MPANPFILKLPQLLSHFLYQNKTLALPGIGVFSLASTFVIPDQEDKEQSQIVQGISFEQTPVLKPDDNLIEFIHSYTGKMKPLAESDLDSYLRLGIQLLNIGKPFHFEGIGSVIKNNEGKFEFVPGEYSKVRLILPSDEKAESAEKRKKVLDEPEKEYAPQSKTAKGILLMLGIIGGIAIIAWAGYNLYKKKTVPLSSKTDSEVVLKEDTDSVQKTDTLTGSISPDSLTAKKKDSLLLVSKRPDSSFYKFVILTTPNKNHAIRRYKQLDSIEHNVKLNTKDSSIFKVYFVIHTSPKDTLHIKDSLNSFYATKTTIEQ